MPTTSPDGLRYPASSAPPNVPVDMSNLAADVQTALTDIRGDVTSLETATQDTGWRNVITTNMNGTNWGGSVYLRRVGSVVTCTCYVDANTGNPFIGMARAGTSPVGALPVGFRPVYRSYGPGLGVVNTSGGARGFVTWDSATSRLTLQDVAGNWALGSWFTFSLVWFTDEAWPSTLPGVAV